MSKKTPIEAALDQVDWSPTGISHSDSELPYATHEGVFSLGNISLRCYRLSDGRAIFHADDMRALFGEIMGGGV